MNGVAYTAIVSTVDVFEKYKFHLSSFVMKLSICWFLLLFIAMKFRDKHSVDGREANMTNKKIESNKQTCKHIKYVYHCGNPLSISS